MERENTQDDLWMQQALTLAKRGEGHTSPNPPVGAIIVKGNRKLAQGYHKRAGGPHAEVEALKKAGSLARGATIYVTLEPCSTQGRTPPCTNQIIAAGLAKVVIATKDPNPKHKGKGIRALKKAGIKVLVGSCKADAERLIAPFTKWITTGIPHVTLKMAITLDGKIADTNGKSKWISGPQSRKLVQKMRAESDAIIVGSNTARIDNPQLLSKTNSRSIAYRVIVDSKGALPLKAKVLNDDATSMTIIATTKACLLKRRAGYINKGAEVWVLPSARGHVSLKSLLSRLGKLGVLRVLCEGGGGLASGLALGGMVDDYVFFMAPSIIGGKNAPTAIDGVGLPLPRAIQLKFEQPEKLGNDIVIRARGPLR
jgi:diaminohydroxyphosphoribosylaminopyrimidine deaminase/5-amino-6-(5-phosphoribosylamino)uracil reductase